MRQVLVDTARAMAAGKRSGVEEVAFVEGMNSSPRPHQCLLALNDALERLEVIDPLKAHLVELRYLGGMTAEESSAAVSVPVYRVRREMRLAKAWLRKEMAQVDQDLAGFEPVAACKQ